MIEDFFGNWAGFILLVILFLSFVRIKFSLGEPFFCIYKPLNFARTLSSFSPLWTKNAAWILDVAAGAKEAEAKDFPTFQLGKKEGSPPSARNRSKRRLRQAFDEPLNANQECAGVG